MNKVLRMVLYLRRTIMESKKKKRRCHREQYGPTLTVSPTPVELASR